MAKGSQIVYDETYKDAEAQAKEGKSKGSKLSVSELKNMTPEEYENYCKNKGW